MALGGKREWERERELWSTYMEYCVHSYQRNQRVYGSRARHFNEEVDGGMTNKTMEQSFASTSFR